MQTDHRVHIADSRQLQAIDSASVALVVTSPPYPMIAMWDEGFGARNPAIRKALARQDGRAAYALMHADLDPVWQEVHRILIPGGFACINIGDAARTVGGTFMLYPNHARVLNCLLEIGFIPLPAVLWRKQTNAPNKFMGSGMYPAGAYVTLEHEYILIVRKGGKREFGTNAEKRRRRESAIFWEERNAWYSDVWLELKGARQRLRDKTARSRSGAYPFELAYRLISMFSVKGDMVVDPFLGTGTTLLAAAAAGRNSIGCEIDPALPRGLFADLPRLVHFANTRIQARLADHLAFVNRCRESGRELKHVNSHYGFPVVTRQETELLIDIPERVTSLAPDGFQASYTDDPGRPPGPPESLGAERPAGQLSLF